MRKTVLLLAVLLGILLTIGCEKEESADSQDGSTSAYTPPTLEEKASDGTGDGADLPSASATDGSLSVNPNAR